MSPLLEFADAVLSSALDPNAIRFRPEDECGVAPVRHAMRHVGGPTSTLKTALNRNAFLCGCLDFLEHEKVEHLIVGFGRRQGSTTKILRVSSVRGDREKVQIPQPLISQATQWHEANHANEVLWVHNHPRTAVNRLVDNLPIASSADRWTLFRTNASAGALLKAAARGGRMRFYLVENEYVREFSTPPLLALGAKLRDMMRR